MTQTKTAHHVLIALFLGVTVVVSSLALFLLSLKNAFSTPKDEESVVEEIRSQLRDVKP